ncbi:ABC transporter permease [Streptomyces sp. NPDC057638]|uniref:ABC transporter permease n=1 Tax=Streptomyces sp. NPDC057638 TaxID=3346190 RepID=UPI00369F809E
MSGNSLTGGAARGITPGPSDPLPAPPPGFPPAGRGGAPGVRGWVRDLALGLRFAVAGGRRGWTRTGLTALGVGLGVAMLLLASSLPGLLENRDDRKAARDVATTALDQPTAGSFLFRDTGTVFRGNAVTGRLVHHDSEGTPDAPPGLTRLPGPGEIAVSPALGELLRSPGGKLLRERLPQRITATIGAPGLIGPDELHYYAGQKLTEESASGRAEGFGKDATPGEGLNGILLLIVLIACIALLMPVAVFIGTAARFGGEQRDRRLAALRLVGADRAATRRVAAGESLAGAVLGLLTGGLLFLLGRQFADRVRIWDITAFPSDIAPSPVLGTLIAVAVPTAAVAVTVFALRQVSIEPLGVVRNARPRRRGLLWRLAAPVVGTLLLAAQAGGVSLGDTSIDSFQIGLGAILVLVGLTLLLPWLVETVVNRADGGPVAWQLAMRRLQLSSGTAARAVSGIVVAAAGAIALQMLFGSVQGQFVKPTGMDPRRAQVDTSLTVADGDAGRASFAAYQKAKGVTRAMGLMEARLYRVGAPESDGFVPYSAVAVADCAGLRELAQLPSCADGDVFVVRERDPMGPLYPYSPRPGAVIALSEPPEKGAPSAASQWRIPADARVVAHRTDPVGGRFAGVLATPSALDADRLEEPTARTLIQLDSSVPDALEHVRNAAARLSPLASVTALQETELDDKFSSVRTGVFVGATLTMVLIAVSLLVSTLEQLRDRRRLLAVLVAFGTRRSTLSWSVLWQTAVPMLLGLALSVGAGLGLGVLLLRMVDTRVTDWWGFLPITAVGGALIALVTLLSLPSLWRMMRPEGLRTE